MAKTASQRRFGKRATELGALRSSQPEAFARVWEQYVLGWIGEIGNRARAQRTGGDAEERRLHVFEVLSQARSLAVAAGAQSHDGVGKSLVVLQHECAKAVAALTDPRLYDFNEDCTTRIRNLSLKNRSRG